MDTGQVTTVMKKNALSISLGVAALIALGVTWFFINPMLNTLDEKVEARAAREETARNLLTADRPNVQVSPSSAAQQEASLPTFPTPEVIQSGRRTMEQVELQAGSVHAAAVEANRQVPLLQRDYETAAEAWPLERRGDDLARAEYQQAYRTYMNADGTLTDGRYPPNSLPGILNATRPPTRDEVSRQVEALVASMEAQEDMDESGEPIAEDYQQRLTEARAELVMQMKFARARNHMFYLDESTGSTGLDIHELATAEEPTAADIFNAQMELWVQESVLGNLHRANQMDVESLPPAEQNLLNAPIKHIIGIEVHGLLEGAMIEESAEGQQRGGERGTGGMEGMEGMGFDPAMMGAGGEGFDPSMGGAGEMESGGTTPPRGRRSGGAAGGTDEDTGVGGLADPVRPGGAGTGEQEQDLPEVELPDDPTSTVERQFAYSVTGRLPHTPVYDLMRFNLTLRCEASAVPFVLQQLQADALITVLNVDMKSVDMAIAANQGYVYGNSPVVELDLQGEMVFLRAWTADLMPTAIKQALAEWSGAGGAVDEGTDELPW